jgi:predicted nucleotidyltransferase
MILQKLAKQGIIHPPKFLPDNCGFLGITGSQSYAVTSGNSDTDVVGWCFPHIDDIFPHLGKNYIPGFGSKPNPFQVWQEHHCQVPETEKSYDFTVYSIVKFFDLVMGNNPNSLEILFTKPRCILHNTEAAILVRDHRKMFLHKGAFSKFRGYAYSNFHKYKDIGKRDGIKPLFRFLKEYNLSLETFINKETPKLNEKELVQYNSIINNLSVRDLDCISKGYDSKAMMHVIRLLGFVEQILVEHDLDLERNKEQLKSVRRGEWTLEQIEKYFEEKKLILEKTYSDSTLPWGPDEKKITNLLISTLEMHYGSLDKAIQRDVNVDTILREMQYVIDKYNV